MSRVIAKIQKLLALAQGKGATPAEAANAAAAAQALMERHQLKRSDIDLENDRVGLRDEALWRGKRKVAWRLELAAGLAHLHACATILSTTRDSVRVQLVGRDSDIDLVTHLFVYLSREIDRRAQAASAKATLVHGKRTWVNNFRLGAVGAVLARLRVMRDERARAMTDVVERKRMALVHIDNRSLAVQRFVEEHVSRVARPGDYRLDASARRIGRAAAANIVIANAIGLDTRQNALGTNKPS